MAENVDVGTGETECLVVNRLGMNAMISGTLELPSSGSLHQLLEHN